MQIDVSTIAVVLSLSSLTQVLALSTQYKVDSTLHGPSWWTLGTVLFAIGFGCNYLRNAPILGSICIVASNTLLCYGFCLLYVGVLRFLGQSERRSALIAVCVAVTLGEIYFTYINNDVADRRVVVSVPLVVISLLIARTFLVVRMRSTAASRYFLVAVFLGQACLMTVGSLILVLPRNAHASAASPSLGHGVLYLGSLVASTLWTFGFIILVNQRLVTDRQHTIEELHSAMEQIKTLSGILPICANCKKIRDDEGSWQQVDAYVSQHTEAKFTHGICPDCAKTVYAKFSSG